MKITHNKVGQNLNLVDSTKADKSGKADKAGGVATKSEAQDFKSILKTDDSKAASKVQVSERAMEAKKIKELAMATPDVDEAKVARFKKMVDEGTYKVDAKAVADRMVDEHLGMMAASNDEE